MAASVGVSVEKPKPVIQPEDDVELQLELKNLVDKILGQDRNATQQAVEALRILIRNSTCSMTSVPKPLKYLAPFYNTLREFCDKVTDSSLKQDVSDVVSVLSMAGGDDAKKRRDCLKYCLRGSMTNVGQWGHEYIRQLESEIIEQTSKSNLTESELLPLIVHIVAFNCIHHAEIQACDLLMELVNLPLISRFLSPQNYLKVCSYVDSCTKYIALEEYDALKRFNAVMHLKAGQYLRSMFSAMQLGHSEYMSQVFDNTEDRNLLIQMAYICSRQVFPVRLKDDDEVNDIIQNSNLSTHFIQFARELDIMEPKSPDDVYKTWLEPSIPRVLMGGDKLDSARLNLASSFVNGFVNAATGNDTLLTVDGGNKWIYRNKEHAMISATASLGLLHLWDVDGGLTPIDKYLYSTDDYIKAGALMALGIVNCKIAEECDPAFALLGDYVKGVSETIQVGAIFGMGLAYIRTSRTDVLDLLVPIVESSTTAEVLGVAALACGMVGLGGENESLAPTLLNRLIELKEHEVLKSPYMRLLALGLGLCFYGLRDDAEIVITAMEVLEEPYRTMAQMLVLMCSYAGTGDVLVIHDLMNIISEKPEDKAEEEETKATGDKTSTSKTPSPKTLTVIKHPEDKSKTKKEKATKDSKKKYSWDYNIGQAIATIAIAVISKGEEIGEEMAIRLLGDIGRYKTPTVRRAVPLAIAYTSISNPQVQVIDILMKYSHDYDDEVACNGIFGLGMAGAGTNNARVAQALRHLAAYHQRNPSQLFMVRIAQGLLHMGKGTMTLNPLYCDRQLMDPVCVAGLVTTMVSIIEPHALILGRSHYLLYSLVLSMNPRWLMTLESETMSSISVPVRVGQAVDVVGKAGTPKTITGIHTHSTPILLAGGERAELATDEYEPYSHILEGIVILKKKEA